MQEPPAVLIVGAGPSGLTLALALLRCGVPIKIIDRSTGHHVGSKGTTIQPRTQELLAFLGIDPYELLKKGTGPLQMRQYGGTDGKTVLRTWEWSEVSPHDPRIPYPRPITLSQESLEIILRQKLHELGTEVDLGTELIDIEQTEDEVVAVIRRVEQTHDENLLRIPVKWLAGCDGARGRTRNILSVEFLGETRDAERMIVADITANGLDNEFWHRWGSFDSEAVGMKPLGTPSAFQLQLIGPKVDFSEITDGTTLPAIFARLSKRDDIQITDVSWFTQYRAVIRLVGRLKVGQCLLVGDAAHCHSPAGGLGLNSSMQDSYNLGWKIALHTRGLATKALVATYESERLPVIADLVDLTTELHDRVFHNKGIAGTQTPSEANSDPMFRPKNIQQLGIHYRFSPIVYDERSQPCDPRAGDRAPDAMGLGPAKDRRLHSYFKPTIHTAIIFCGAAGKTVDALVDGLLPYQKRGLCNINIARRRGAVDETPAEVSSDSLYNVLDEYRTDLSHVVDDSGALFAAYGTGDCSEGGPCTAVVVRPDGIIGAFVLTQEGVDKYFRGIGVHAY